jgi:hypothetical protein
MEKRTVFDCHRYLLPYILHRIEQKKVKNSRKRLVFIYGCSLQNSIPYAHHYISRGLNIFQDHFFVFKNALKNSALMYGWYSRVVCNEERVMMARVLCTFSTIDNLFIRSNNQSWIYKFRVIFLPKQVLLSTFRKGTSKYPNSFSWKKFMVCRFMIGCMIWWTY